MSSNLSFQQEVRRQANVRFLFVFASTEELYKVIKLLQGIFKI